MTADVGVKIGIQGEKQFRDQLKNINQQVKTLNSEMKAVGAEFANTGDKEKYVTDKTKLLNQSIETQQKKVAELTKKLEESTRETGENSAATLKWRQSLATAQTKLSLTEKELKDLNSTLDDTGDEMEDASGKTSRFGDVLKANLASAAVVGAITGAISAIVNAVKKLSKALLDTVKDAAAYGDEILTLSTQTGLAVSTLQEFKFMQNLVDVDLSTMTGALSRLTRNMGKADEGSGSAQKAFTRLGVAITDSNGDLRDNEEVFYDLIDALGRVENETERDVLAMEIFGKSAQELNPLIEQGTGGIRDFIQQAYEMGYVLDDNAIAALGRLQDAFDKINLAIETIKLRLGVELAPLFEDLAQRFVDWVSQINWEDFSAKVGSTIDKIIEFVDGINWNDVYGKINSIFQIIGKTVDLIERLLDRQEDFKEMVGTYGPVEAVLRRTLTRQKSVEEEDWQGKVIGGIVEATENGATRVKKTVSDLTNFFGISTKTMSDDAQQTAATVDTTTRAVGSGWAATRAAAEANVNQTKTAVDTAYKTIKNSAEVNMAATETATTGTWGKIEQNTSAALAGINSDVDSSMGETEQTADTSLDKVQNTFKSSFAAIKQEITAVFAGLEAWIRDIGQKIMTGLWSGISSKLSWLRQQIRAAVDEIKRQFSGVEGFNVNSPSRWSRELAENIMRGFPLGFADGMRAATSAAFGAVGGIQAAMRQPIMTSQDAFGSVMASALTNLPEAIGGGEYKFDLKVMLDDSTQLARKVFRLSKQGEQQVGASYAG